MLKDKKIGFIGAGTMAKAIMKGLGNSGITTLASDIISQPEVMTNNKELVRKSDIIILSVKPFAVESILKEINNELTANHLIVSIAAGVSTEKIENVIDKKLPVIRVMPNTPALVGEGMSAVCKGKFATDEHSALIMELFKAVGRCIEVKEELINAVTGISGSGPAFIYLIIEALADGGVKLGLKKEVAIELAAQTTLGAAKMVLETGKHPALLKDEVTTPGGCTIAGLAVMENEKVRSALIKTVQETAKVASELG
ncbi:MAG: pyrroline-5-carboxylate reductase [Candidatus Melainabacteria bacterium GWF2_37_15]|nr:MAG: pyrroline-5-carboxylate reductase [Candidatus Melainabacteria bacterium GWF2_37_15]